MNSDHQKQEAFRAFVREQQAPLRGFVRMLGVHSSSVDDLAQETFLVAYRELDGFDPDQDFGKWLRGIARNLVRNELRRNARRGRLMDEHVTAHLFSASDSHDDEPAFGATEFHALRDCMESLPEKSRMLIDGRYVDEWNASILADKFGMSATAVRLALMRIRRQLNDCITERLSDA